MRQIVVNSIDGILAALFAILIIMVHLDAFWVWVKAIKAKDPLPSAEAPFEESTAAQEHLARPHGPRSASAQRAPRRAAPHR
ncbi:hypothetical protein AB0B45_24110 [Nonomuraea sp. NPDC049152]|uniref:hypothetical protein n=1 Tax=Nonomuraea sp. NPDC049152 TaxID=3154350 RepID=UPI0033DC9775